MKLIYSFSILLYSRLVAIASFFNKKAKLRYEGVKESFGIIKKFNANNVIWFHCASVGEFEQGRPLIEKLKKEKPKYKIAISFFSPSAYELRKNYELADLVFYLPNDSKRNSKKLIKLLKPSIVVFVKYEFWHWYLSELKNNKIPTYLISGIFRESQIFFKPYGKFYRKILLNFTHLFVQNKTSSELLKSINIQNVTVAGDTRFDRVSELAKNKKSYPIIESFVNNNLVFIAGSTWKKDEEIIFNFINNTEKENIKYIIAPHEISSENINRIKRTSTKKTILYSKANSSNVVDARVLIIDNIGMLSSLYSYADVAYVGGGFGAGIHNTLEAAVFGIPIIFGTNYNKFDEAKELLKRNAAFSINNAPEFNFILNKLFSEADFREQCGEKASKYVKENIGASNKIFKVIGF